MTTYNWYCPDCGREDYGLDEDTPELKTCKSCGADMCRLEPDSAEDTQEQEGAADSE